MEALIFKPETKKDKDLLIQVSKKHNLFCEIVNDNIVFDEIYTSTFTPNFKRILKENRINGHFHIEGV